MLRITLAFVGFYVAITMSSANVALATPATLPGYSSETPSTNDRPALRWGAGLRAQTVYTTQAITELGADAVVFPWRHLGFGFTALQGAGANVPGCEPAPTQPCGPYWRAILPYTELRLLPTSWISPYARGSLGVAWGDFSRDATRPDSVVFTARSELGLDFHHRVSLRLFFITDHLRSSSVRVDGLGGGLQLGLFL